MLVWVLGETDLGDVVVGSCTAHDDLFILGLGW